MRTTFFFHTKITRVPYVLCPFKVTKVVRTDTNRAATYDFLLTIHGNHAPISYSFRGKRRFQSKIAIFPSTPVYLAAKRMKFIRN